ncbi:hypothetical protein ACUXZZ_44755 [Streptomyces graminifolii]|uniref:hypothetical protein n=1 Tax=Streptomyces graminifolii TaxID=1266771 RepID=UPI00405A335B
MYQVSLKMRPRRQIAYFVASLAFSFPLVSGCYASTDYEKYPEGRFVSTASLVRDWRTGSTSLNLQQNAKFSASRLKLEYFSCPKDGIHEKDGDGTWSSDKGRQRSEVLLRFNDGCTATLWAGVTNGHAVLWGDYSGADKIVILK